MKMDILMSGVERQRGLQADPSSRMRGKQYARKYTHFGHACQSEREQCKDEREAGVTECEEISD